MGRTKAKKSRLQRKRITWFS